MFFTAARSARLLRLRRTFTATRLALLLGGLALGLVALGTRAPRAHGQNGPVESADPGPVASAGVGDRIILASGPLLGILEPCRCTEGMLGGLPRRAQLVARFASTSPTLVDLGDLAKPDETSETNLELTESAALEALATIAGLGSGSEPALVACGCTEVRLGLERVHKLAVPFYPKVCLLWPTNLVPTKGWVFGNDGPVGVEYALRTDVVVSAIDAALVSETAELKVTPASELFLAPAPEGDTRRRVVLYHGEAAAAARDFDDVSSKRVAIVICGHTEHPEPTRVLKGGVVLVTLGTKGQSLRALALPSGFEAGKLGPRAEQSHDLDALVPDLASVRAVLDRLYEKQAEQVPDAPKQKPDEQGGTYVGTETCLECHEAVGKIWRPSRHAHALEKLREKDPLRAKLGSCLRCHTVGFDYEGGWKPDTKTSGLDAVGCESCHGPGSNHVARAREAPDTALGFGRPPGKWPLRWRGRCLTCHDPANSPGFDLDVYLERIRHWKNGDR